MTVDELPREALNISGGREVFSEYVWRAAQELLDAGVPAEQIVGIFNSIFDQLGERGEFDAQDEVAEVLNSLTGYCSPGARLRAS